MQVSVEAGEGLERRMKIDLPFEQIAVEVDKRLRQLARSVKLSGFRPGKVPMKVLRHRFEERVQMEVFGDLVQSCYADALAQESLRPAGLPRIEPEIDVQAQRAAFTAIFEVMPEFELAPLAERGIKRPVCELTDADLDRMIEQLRQQRKTWTAVERPCQRGDRVTVSFAGTLDGQAFAGGSATGLAIELGSGQMLPGFEDGLIGASVGEQRQLDLTFPVPYHVERLAGQAVRLDVTLETVSEPNLPDIDTEFAKSYGIVDGDVDRFMADVRANMEREMSQRIAASLKERVMDLLLEANPIDLPGALVETEMKALSERMSQNGDGEKKPPSWLFEGMARRRVALGLILGRVIDENAIKLDTHRVRETIERMASTYERPQEVIDYYYSDRQRLGTVEAQTIEDQVVDLVMERVVVEDEAIAFADLANPSVEA